ncbi:DEAD/DEAH box helicase [Vibrio mexicanus]|uniref:DEAD/DEAH box helicase n=1 Tax=Vibrio mexicanus TaxID=1004326 RepID=UPI00069A44EA|nr:DEAD/DEAH box helicase family protein [Vibrio mexicanus]
MQDIDYVVKELFSTLGYHAVSNHKMGYCFEHESLPPVIVDTDFKPETPHHYVDYTSHQNALMSKHSGVYRFIGESEEELLQQINFFLLDQSNDSDLSIKAFGADRSHAHLDPTPPEFNFESTFEEVFGSKMLYALHQEESYIDRKGHRRYIDFMLYRNDKNIAIELNGERYHHPLLISRERYHSQLFKQNSLIKDGNLVFRWSDRGMRDDFKFKEQLKNYFGDSVEFKATPYFKAHRSVDFQLYQHQTQAVEGIEKQRLLGKNAFLVVLPTGTGKTEVFIEDFRRQIQQGKSLSALALVPTRDLRDQLIERITRQLPNITISTTLNDSVNLTVVTNAAIVRNHKGLDSNKFDYILVDEAHKAAANGMKNVLEHFNPSTLLGLTATDERLDQRKLEDIFGTYQVNMTLEEAIEQGHVPQIRVYRLETNIDFSKVRFNGKEFVKSDLQKTVQVPSRDKLIADTLSKYFSPDHPSTLDKQGIVFCVDVAHTQRMAKALNKVGISAKSVHGKDRSAIEEYFSQDIQFLCACELLSEGWDAPNTSIVVMARPTMSKAKYMQQLGRGTRLAPNKEALYVIDIVDNYIGASLQPWSAHNLFNNPNYLPFGDMFNADQPTPQQELLILDGLFETERRIEPINIFNFEAEFGDLLNEEQLARELFVSTGTIKSWLKKGEITPSKSISLGRKNLHYFSPENMEHIRLAKNIKPRTEESRKDDFFEFLEKRDYTFSYKIVFLLSFIALANEQGEADSQELALLYQDFYQGLLDTYGRCEKASNPLNQPENLSDLSYVKRSISANPFEKFERKRFFHDSKELTLVAMDSLLWERLSDDEWKTIHQQMIEDAKKYFDKIEISITENDLRAFQNS